MIPVALTIAGSDPSGGAGLQADLKTFHQFGVYGEAVVTLITAQNTRCVYLVDPLPANLVIRQLRAVLEDIPPAAAKTGALGNAELVQAIAEASADFQFPLVVDPVMISKHGVRLLSEEGTCAIVERLIPRAFLLMPNLQEASALTARVIENLEDMREAARVLHQMGAQAVLIKGGHLPDTATDLLFTGENWHEFPAPHIQTRHTHGTGCTFSAAITAQLAAGVPLETAVARAKRFITEAIASSPGLGGGAGPVNHHARPEDK